MQVKLQLHFKTTIDGETDTQALSCTGNLHKTNLGYTLTYMETLEESTTAVKILISDKNVEIHRKGTCSVTFIMEPGIAHTCAYSTPYGVMNMKVTAHTVENKITECGGSLFIHYSLDLNGETDHILSITIEKE